MRSVWVFAPAVFAGGNTIIQIQRKIRTNTLITTPRDPFSRLFNLRGFSDFLGLTPTWLMARPMAGWEHIPLVRDVAPSFYHPWSSLLLSCRLTSRCVSGSNLINVWSLVLRIYPVLLPAQQQTRRDNGPQALHPWTDILGDSQPALAVELATCTKKRKKKVSSQGPPIKSQEKGRNGTKKKSTGWLDGRVIQMSFGDAPVSRLVRFGLHPKTNSNVRILQGFGIMADPAFQTQYTPSVVTTAKLRGFLHTITMDSAASYSAQFNICRRRLIYKRCVFGTPGTFARGSIYPPLLTGSPG